MNALKPEGKNRAAPLHGVSLSKSGIELLSIIDIQPNEEYTKALTTFFKRIDYSIVPVNIS